MTATAYIPEKQILDDNWKNESEYLSKIVHYVVPVEDHNLNRENLSSATRSDMSPKKTQDFNHKPKQAPHSKKKNSYPDLA